MRGDAEQVAAGEKPGMEAAAAAVSKDRAALRTSGAAT